MDDLYLLDRTVDPIVSHGYTKSDQYESFIPGSARGCNSNGQLATVGIGQEPFLVPSQ